jgi:hypothetical protein
MRTLVVPAAARLLKGKIPTDRPPSANQDSPGAKKGKEPEHPQEPVHLYASAPDATHGIIPGRAKPAAKGPTGHYHNNTNIHDPQVAWAVYKRAMEASIMVTQHELLSLAPEVQAQVADSTVWK